MFNSYSYSSGGHASASANNYLKINAISGTLVKNHPKSIFVIAKVECILDDAEIDESGESLDALLGVTV